MSKPTTILIVDDSETDQHSYQRAFRDRQGFTLVAARSGAAGLAAMAEVQPDLVLLDYNLPDMDGLAFMASLAGARSFPLRVVMVTGEGNESIAVAAMKHGAIDYLIKHVDGRHLTLLPQVVEHALERLAALEAKRVAEQALKERTRELYAREQELREALSLNQSIILTSDIGIAAFRQDGQCIMVNPSFAQTVGGPQEQVLAQNFRHLHTWRESSLLGWAESVLDTGVPVDGEVQSVSSFGRQVWMHCQMSRFMNQGEPHLLLMVHDTTAERQAVEALRQSEAALRATLDSLPYLTWLKDGEGRYITINKAYADHLHLENSLQAVGRTDMELHPRDLAEEYRADDARVMKTRKSKHVEVQADEGGEVRWLETFKTPIIDSGGKLLGTVGYAKDVTERKNMEAELRAAKIEAERASNAKSRFLAAASHDLRQPLAALKLYVSVLKNRLDPGDKELLVNMEACVGGLSDLLSKLLDLSKLEAGVVQPKVSNFALRDMLKQVISAHAPEAEAKGLSLRCVCRPLDVRTDPVLFQRIVGNLVANALQYTEQGGVLIGTRRRQGRMWVEVWDTGVGIPADKTGEIFEEFKRLGGDAATNGGSGLGLTIVAKTASLLGLQIRVHSRPGRGSVFAVEVPLGRKAARAASRPEPRPAGARLAVVDDNAVVLHALTLALRASGHEVVAAADGADMLAKLGGLAPDIIVSDYRLGSQTGFDVISAGRAAFGAGLPGVILTGDIDPKLMRSMARQGMVILHKPVEIDALLAHIEKALQ